MATYTEIKEYYQQKRCYRPVWNLGMFLWKLDFINAVPIRKSKLVIKDLNNEDLEATDWVVEE